MTTLINAVKKANNKTTTENGATAFASTMDANLDLFFKIGASRGKNVLAEFSSALAEDKDKAIRIALWARDVRGGAGERQIYREILRSLACNHPSIAKQLIKPTIEVGRWDDLLVFIGTSAEKETIVAIKAALEAGDALCAKWMPRKGSIAAKLRTEFGWTPKFYRKTLVGLTSVVESAMCANEWTEIDYSKLPSVASARYQKAFGRNDQTRYAAYLASLEKGETTINAGAVYPYDIVKSVRYGNARVADQQWKALPDYVGEGNFLCMVDVSGSMTCPAGGNPAVACLDVAISLGLYCSERAKGKFKDTFLTFSDSPELLTLNGPLSTRYSAMSRSNWAMSTDIIAGFDLILNAAVKYNVAQEEMPDTVIILSDMQFNQCSRGFTTFKDVRKRYEAAGYVLPKLVFWNLNARDNAPAKSDKEGVALVSGFSPSLMRTVLSKSAVTPLDMMNEVIMVDRYNWQ